MTTNVNRPMGFRASRYLDGSPYNGQNEAYAFSASQASNAYMGDVVQIDDTNRSTALTDRYLPGILFIKPVVAAATTNAVRGVIAGFVPEPEFSMSATASLGLKYRVASTARYAWVVQDYGVVFEAQEDGNSYTSASSNGLNKTTDIAYTAGNSTTGVSGAQVDSSEFQTAAARPLRALRYTQRVDNFGFSAADSTSYAKMDILLANSDLAQAVATQYGA